MTSISPKSPDQLRRERAATEFPRMRFQLATVKLKDRETGEPCGQLGICYVFSPSGEMYTVTLKQSQTSGCSCSDARRRGLKCKHAYATEMYLGAGPEPPAEPAPRPAPLQRWAARALETPAERDARILKERDLLWD